MMVCFNFFRLLERAVMNWNLNSEIKSHLGKKWMKDSLTLSSPQSLVFPRRLDLEAEDPFDGTFDLIYSRDCFMHIVGKAEMYKKIKVCHILLRKLLFTTNICFQKWLKPGGQVLMTTYVVGVNTDHPDDFKDYLKNQRGYILVTRAKEEELWKRHAT